MNNFQIPNLAPVMPEMIMTCAALVILFLDLFIKKREALSGLSILAAVIVGFSLFNSELGTTFSGMFVADGYAVFFKMVFLVSLVLSILVSGRYLDIQSAHQGEYYPLMIFATIGMMIMASSADLVILYVGLELMALSTYILAGFMKKSTKSNEAAVKYLLLGAFASGFLLFAISLTYGLTGSTNIREIAAYISANSLMSSPALMMALLMFVSAFSFKVAAVPFHMWAPDVYEGAPTSVTAFMSVGPKAAGFAVMGRVFLVGFASMGTELREVLIPIAVLTMAIGNIVALAQTNIKRMLAYSSIAHAGYALVGLIAGGQAGVASMMNYMLIYAFMNIGAFAIVIMLCREGFKGEEITEYEGLSKTHPLSALLMLVFMFSLTGIPPTAGFVGKFYIISAALESGFTALAIIMVIFSAISAYYYMRIVMYMYMREPSTEPQLATSRGLNMALALSVAGVILIGILPASVLEFASEAAKGFFAL
jgi:NADH-quinone oxidoreductase subunit N